MNIANCNQRGHALQWQYNFYVSEIRLIVILSFLRATWSNLNSTRSRWLVSIHTNKQYKKTGKVRTQNGIHNTSSQEVFDTCSEMYFIIVTTWITKRSFYPHIFLFLWTPPKPVEYDIDFGNVLYLLNVRPQCQYAPIHSVEWSIVDCPYLFREEQKNNKP